MEAQTVRTIMHSLNKYLMSLLQASHGSSGCCEQGKEVFEVNHHLGSCWKLDLILDPLTLCVQSSLCWEFFYLQTKTYLKNYEDQQLEFLENLNVNLPINICICQKIH